MTDGNEEPSVSRRRFLRAAGGAGGAVAATGAASATEGGGGGNSTHTVAMTDSNVYDPADITVAPGDTVVWENTGSAAHTVTAYEEDIPDGASYFASGDFDGEDAARSGYPGGGVIEGGESYEYTFETTGTYEYFCIPHETVGMVGTVSVVPGGASEESGPVSILPDSAKTIGVATTGALTSVLALAYFFIKYGGDYGEVEE